jgi:hypothetical protein
MFTFAAKPRQIRLRQGARLTLPSDVTLARGEDYRARGLRVLPGRDHELLRRGKPTRLCVRIGQE